MLLIIIMFRTALFLSLLLFSFLANVTYFVRANVSVAEKIEKNVPSSWTQKACSICRCDYENKTVNCSNIDLHDGLPSASDFPTEQVKVL